MDREIRFDSIRFEAENGGALENSLFRGEEDRVRMISSVLREFAYSQGRQGYPRAGGRTRVQTFTVIIRSLSCVLRSVLSSGISVHVRGFVRNCVCEGGGGWIETRLKIVSGC